MEALSETLVCTLKTSLHSGISSCSVHKRASATRTYEKKPSLTYETHKANRQTTKLTTKQKRELKANHVKSIKLQTK